MDGLNERMEAAGRALFRLHEGTAREELSDLERDGMIHRFEYCFELLWKCGKDFLLDREGLEAASPKRVIRILREVGIFDDSETEHLLRMLDDRNMTAHTYDEALAAKLAVRIREHEKLMQEWYRRMQS